ncbi:MAG: hypothetical protein ACR2OO_01890 [Thermomicrobiales bacterium]
MEQFQHLDPDVRIGYVEATALPAGDYDLLGYFGQTFQNKKVTIVAGAVTRITVVTGIGGGLAVFVANPDGSPYLGGFCDFIHDEFGTSYDLGQGGCDGDRNYDQHDDRWYGKDGEIANALTVGDYVVVVSDANHGVVKPIRHVTVSPGRAETVVAVTFGTAAVTMEFAGSTGRSVSGGCIQLTQSNPELAPIQAGQPELADFVIGGTRSACLESGHTVMGLAPGSYTVQALGSPAGFSMPVQPLPFTVADGQHEIVSIRPDGLHTETATPTPTATPMPTPTATVTPAPAPKPNVSLRAPSGKVGANLAVMLGNFPANTTATVKIAGRTLGTVAIAGNGSGGATFRIPSLTGGRHTVVATDGAIKASRSLTVSAAQSLAPTTVKAGTSVTVSVTGFGANATLSIRLHKPNGSPDYRIVGTIYTDKSGAGHLTVLLPPSSLTGKRRIATYGPESHASGYVTVTAP